MYHKLEGVKRIKARMITGKILIVDSDFKDTEDDFLQRQADIVITLDGIVIKSRWTKLPVNTDPENCSVDGHVARLKKAVYRAIGCIRKIRLDL